ncbi:MAG: threonylcarbamoyl-AMP synthase [Candidatus Pacebacteria bacterium]|nr:threonylcarbamoyl-AMP synthase [Candidatus Paceibacterota bacterium]
MKSFQDIIKEGGVAVLRTDTLYGLVADAKNQQAVDRIYDIKKRNPLKPVIVLVDSYKDIESFGIHISSELKMILGQYWPGKVSILLPANDTSVNTHYIHKGTGSIAFRIPDNEELRAVLRDVGPLVAPSANPEGKEPARTIQEAIDYFGDAVDYYADGGEVIDTKASKIIKISKEISEEVIRP